MGFIQELFLPLEIKNLKKAYKMLYLKSRSLDLKRGDQDILLQKLLDEKLQEGKDKNIDNTNDKEINTRTSMINDYFNKWKKECDKEYYK